MDMSAFKALAREIEASEPGFVIDSTGTGDGLFVRRTGLVLDAAEVFAQVGAGHKVVDIVCDTLTWADGLSFSLVGAVQTLRLIARRLIVEGNGELVIDVSDPGDARDRAIMLVGERGGTLNVRFIDGKNQEKSMVFIPALEQREDGDPLKGCIYRAEGGGEARYILPRGQGLLQTGGIFHNVLELSFDLAAAIVSAGRPTAEELQQAHNILGWIGQWGARAPEFASLIHDANELSTMIPARRDGELLPYVSDRHIDDYIEAAESLTELAESQDLKASFERVDASNRQALAEVVEGWRNRDGFDLAKIATSIRVKQDELVKVDDALVRAAQQIIDFRFDQELQQILLEGEFEVHKIDVIAKATFDLISALGQICTGAAMVCAGMPPNLSAGQMEALDDVGDTIKLVESVRSLSDLATWLVMLGGQYKAVPTLVGAMMLRQGGSPDGNQLRNQENWRQAQFSGGSSKLSGGLRDGSAAINTLANAGAAGDAASALMDDIADIIASTTDHIKPLEARAQWETVRVKAVNALDLLINNDGMSSGIRKTAAEYKTAVESICIYGAHQGELTALRAQRMAEVGTLIQEQISVTRKQSELDRVHEQLTKGEVGADAAALAEQQLRRSRALRRRFLLTALGFRSAFEFSSMGLARTLPTLIGDAGAMREMLAVMGEDRRGLRVSVEDKTSDFRKTIVLDGPEVAKLLRENKPLPIDLWPVDGSRGSEPDLAARLGERALKALDGFSLPSVTRVEAYVLGVPGTKPAPVRMEINSSGRMWNRNGGARRLFCRDPQRAPFEYAGREVQLSRDFTGLPPSPFSDWSIAVRQNEDAPHDLSEATGIELVLIGKALV